MLNAEIIAVGSEMLTPTRVDTNSLWLTEQLNAIGIEVKLKIVVGDDEARLEETVRDALKRSEVIIATGGLGPTEDDITRKIFSRVLGRRLQLHDATLDRIRKRFAARGYQMPEINARQALVPEGAQLLENERGTAPGLLMTEKNCTVVLLPGPPRELKPMFTSQVLPLLARRAGGTIIRRRRIGTFGLTESGVDEIAAPVYARLTNPSTTILADRGIIDLHLAARASSEAEAERMLDDLSGRLEEALGHHVFSTRGETLEEVIAEWLRFRNYTIAVAESCTGGLLAGRITDVPGSSDYFLAGVVAYANEAKTELLGVPAELIAAHGAVSAEVAEAMAEGVRRRAGTTIGVAVTGIAGPDGGTEEKPVGLVYIGFANEVAVESRRFLFPSGDRYLIRQFSINAALNMVRRRLQ
ncbi:MAG: competence/damage-inducible protein A [Blastocatellales bacterium]|nr:competence/damage-inducible protein A [Blastocatellales bacterium]